MLFLPKNFAPFHSSVICVASIIIKIATQMQRKFCVAFAFATKKTAGTVQPAARRTHEQTMYLRAAGSAAPTVSDLYASFSTWHRLFYPARTGAADHTGGSVPPPLGQKFHHRYGRSDSGHLPSAGLPGSAPHPAAPVPGSTG